MVHIVQWLRGKAPTLVYYTLIGIVGLSGGAYIARNVYPGTPKTSVPITGMESGMSSESRTLQREWYSFRTARMNEILYEYLPENCSPYLGYAMDGSGVISFGVLGESGAVSCPTVEGLSDLIQQSDFQDYQELLELAYGVGGYSNPECNTNSTK